MLYLADMSQDGSGEVLNWNNLNLQLADMTGFGEAAAGSRDG